jgi:hypothetical protein
MAHPESGFCQVRCFFELRSNAHISKSRYGAHRLRLRRAYVPRFAKARRMGYPSVMGKSRFG